MAERHLLSLSANLAMFTNATLVQKARNGEGGVTRSSYKINATSEKCLHDIERHTYVMIRVASAPPNETTTRCRTVNARTVRNVQRLQQTRLEDACAIDVAIGVDTILPHQTAITSAVKRDIMTPYCTWGSVHCDDGKNCNDEFSKMAVGLALHSNCSSDSRSSGGSGSDGSYSCSECLRERHAVSAPDAPTAAATEAVAASSEFAAHQITRAPPSASRRGSMHSCGVDWGPSGTCDNDRQTAGTGSCTVHDSAPVARVAIGNQAVTQVDAFQIGRFDLSSCDSPPPLGRCSVHSAEGGSDSHSIDCGVEDEGTILAHAISFVAGGRGFVWQTEPPRSASAET